MARPLIDTEFNEGEFFQVSQSQIYIFGAVAFFDGSDYYVGKCSPSWEIDQASLKMVMRGADDGESGKLVKKLDNMMVSRAKKGLVSRMLWMLVSSDVLAKLFLDETVQMHNFENAYDQIKVLPGFGDQRVVILPKVAYEFVARLPGEKEHKSIFWQGKVVVVDCQAVGKNVIRFFDQNGLEV